ncbi:hypothetical protein L208DRAFT_1375496 [Tricholoma matsutake]|nr:hypothetical protein L208DRAFT_1375496 [Tricholoma matsutake 945]
MTISPFVALVLTMPSLKCQEGNVCIFHGVHFLLIRDNTKLLICNGRSYLVLFLSPDASNHQIQSMKSLIAVAIYNLLKEDLANIKASGNLIHVKHNPCYTQTCDKCMIVLMGNFWICQNCGRDLCNKCHGAAIAISSCQGQDVVHHNFVQVTHFVEKRALSIQCGFPLVLSCDIKEPLNPKFFIDHYKGVPCNVIGWGGGIHYGRQIL